MKDLPANKGRTGILIAEVEGLRDHEEAVAQFCLAVCEAASRRGRFGAELRAAEGRIEVDGTVGERRWRIGHLAADAVHGVSLPAEAAIHAIRIGRRGPYAISVAVARAAEGVTET